MRSLVVLFSLLALGFVIKAPETTKSTSMETHLQHTINYLLGRSGRTERHIHTARVFSLLLFAIICLLCTCGVRPSTFVIVPPSELNRTST